MTVYLLTIFSLCSYAQLDSCCCTDCLSECRCGNANGSGECIDCIWDECADIENYDCTIVWWILTMVACVCACFGVCGWCKKWSARSKLLGTCILSFIFFVSGNIYFSDCHWGKVSGCDEGGDGPLVIGLCCKIKITKQTHTIVQSVLGLGSFSSAAGFLWAFCKCVRESQNEDNTYYTEMDQY
eukprot:171752_1